MADLVTPYIKEEDGTLVPVAAIYDKNGNDITSYYQAKTGLSLSKDSEGYTVVVEE